MPEAEIGVIGISGYSSPFDDADSIELETPYGSPSAPIELGRIGDTTVAFLPRRGVEEEIPPLKIPFRANVWAMNEIGVRRIVAPVVCGSLHMDVELGTFVVSDQFVDRTWGRLSIVTDYDVGMEGGGAVSALSVARTITEQREHLRALLDAAIPRIGPQPTDVCSTALGRARVRF